MNCRRQKCVIESSETARTAGGNKEGANGPGGLMEGTGDTRGRSEVARV
jgi:hypothetical protein